MYSSSLWVGREKVNQSIRTFHATPHTRDVCRVPVASSSTRASSIRPRCSDPFHNETFFLSDCLLRSLSRYVLLRCITSPSKPNTTTASIRRVSYLPRLLTIVLQSSPSIITIAQIGKSFTTSQSLAYQRVLLRLVWHVPIEHRLVHPSSRWLVGLRLLLVGRKSCATNTYAHVLTRAGRRGEVTDVTEQSTSGEHARTLRNLRSRESNRMSRSRFTAILPRLNVLLRQNLNSIFTVYVASTTPDSGSSDGVPGARIPIQGKQVAKIAVITSPRRVT